MNEQNRKAGRPRKYSDDSYACIGREYEKMKATHSDLTQAQYGATKDPQISARTVRRAIKLYKLNPEKPNPTTV